MKLLCKAMAVTALIGSPALAQTTTSGDAAETMAAPVMSMETWTDASIGTFFADTTMQNLRPATEIEARFTDLSQSEKEQVRRECALLTNDDSASGDTSESGGSDMSNRTGDAQDATSGAATTGDTQPEAAVQGTGGLSAAPAGEGGLSDTTATGQAGASDAAPSATTNSQSEPAAGDDSATGTGGDSAAGAAWASRDLNPQMWVQLCDIVETLPES